MPTPKQGYRLKDGSKVPGTTTIIGRFKESGALIRWAYNRGKDGLDLYESRDKAAELGTIVHSMVEKYIHIDSALDDASWSVDSVRHHLIDTRYLEWMQEYLEPLSEEESSAVLSAFSAFVEWYISNNFTVISQEEELVSEEHRFGGTPDAVARDQHGRIVLLDWKTSSGIYVDHLAQLGAYRILWDENHPDTPLTGGSHLCRFAKANGDFAHHYFPDLDQATKFFLLLRDAYDLDQNLKRRAK
jgi:hypothetical protein